MKFFKLFEPLKIGNIEIRNRFVLPAMHLGDSQEGFITSQIIEFYRRRAQGGMGLIIIGGMSVSKRGRGVSSMISLSDDKFIPKLKELTRSVHKEGAKICAQLYHAGAYSFSRLIGEKAVSSSEIYSRFTHEYPRALSTAEVLEVEDIIINAARRAHASGFDSIELLGSAGYLVDQFLSPIKNNRTDKYGGKSIEERLTFPLELIKRMKEKLGDKIIIGCRLSGDDFVPGSNTYLEKKIVAKAFEKAGVQYINVTGGWHETRVPQIPMDTPRSAFSYLAKEIRNTVSIPVFASNRINDPIVAENLLQDFYADAICFGRASIADPDFPLKTKENRLNEIRNCVGCNIGCFDRVFELKTLHCSVNPFAMNELRYKNPKKAETKKKVIVIGAGPAGLEAGRMAKKFGHNVIIYEKSDKIGGQLNVACIPPGREELHNIIDYYKTQINMLDIPCKFGSIPTHEEILKEKPDYVFCSTGVNFSIPDIKGVDGSQNCNICISDHALSGDCQIGKKVVIIGGAATGVETALWAAKKGAMNPEVAKFLAFYKALPEKEAIQRTFRGDREVHILEYLQKIGNSIGKSTKWVFLNQLKKLGVYVKTNVNIFELKNNTVFYKQRSPDGQKGENGMDEIDEIEKIDNVDTFILATGVVPNYRFAKSLKKYIKENKERIQNVPKIIRLGDSKRVGTILDAIHSGFKASYRLGKF